MSVCYLRNHLRRPNASSKFLSEDPEERKIVLADADADVDVDVDVDLKSC